MIRRTMMVVALMVCGACTSPTAPCPQTPPCPNLQVIGHEFNTKTCTVLP